MKVALSEKKKNLQESTMEVMKSRIKIIIWSIRKKKAFNHNSKKKKKVNPPLKKKTEARKRSLWDISKCTIIEIIGMPEGEEEEQEIETLFEKIMKENFPNLVKEINI